MTKYDYEDTALLTVSEAEIVARVVLRLFPPSTIVTRITVQPPDRLAPPHVQPGCTVTGVSALISSDGTATFCMSTAGNFYGKRIFVSRTDRSAHMLIDSGNILWLTWSLPNPTYSGEEGDMWQQAEDEIKQVYKTSNPFHRTMVSIFAGDQNGQPDDPAGL